MTTKTPWRIVAEEIMSCNCDWGCTTAGDKLNMEHRNTYAQFARVEWGSDGSTK